jgi:hypothetical protein
METGVVRNRGISKIEAGEGPVPEIVILCSVPTWRQQVDVAVKQRKRFALIGPPLDADLIARLSAVHGLKSAQRSPTAVELWPE